MCFQFDYPAIDDGYGNMEYYTVSQVLFVFYITTFAVKRLSILYVCPSVCQSYYGHLALSPSQRIITYDCSIILSSCIAHFSSLFHTFCIALSYIFSVCTLRNNKSTGVGLISANTRECERDMRNCDGKR